jgi:RluA family pseudouridine synthase
VSELPPLVPLYEEEGLLAIAKPPGEPVIPARDGSARDCVQRRLERQLGRRLWVVHRIDRDASGVVVFAKDAATHRRLSQAFEKRQVAKTYDAVVAGALAPPEGRLDVPLHAARKGKTRPARPGEPGAQAALTEYETLRRWQLDGHDLAHVEARPSTGRHHQIRVHLRFAGAPILFDPLYARGLLPAALAGAPCRRLALHARQLDLPATAGDGRLVVDCPLAPDLQALLAWLDATADKA